MEPQDTPPYAPLDSEPTVAPPPTGRTATQAARAGERDHTRRNVALAAGATFVAAMIGMAAARSGSTGSARSTQVPTPAANAPTQQQLSSGDEPFFPDGDSVDDGFGRQPRAAQPGVPFFNGGGQTQSHGS
jgi:hypothetical protein